MRRIPLVDTPRQELEATLDGQTVRIEMTWLPLTQKWYLSLWIANRAVALSRQVVTKALLLHEHAQTRGFRGDFWVSRAEGAAEPPLHAWGSGWNLYYLTQDEADALGDWK